MKKLCDAVPIPAGGLMLALAATGNLIGSYGAVYRYIFGALSAMFLFLLIAKFATNPRCIVEGFRNPVVASVMATITMGVMILTTYIKPYFPEASLGIWVFALLLHVILIAWFTKKYILNFDIVKVFPSYFIVYVGIVVGSVTAPAHNMVQWGQLIFWFGFVSYLALLPLVIYRVVKVKNIPEPALPTLIIFAAPASLCLAGYLSSFPIKNMLIIRLLATLAIVMATYALVSMPKLLKLKFYPSYCAFTFPFVISAIALKGLNVFLLKSEATLPVLGSIANFLEIWTVLIVLYVLVRYAGFLVPGIVQKRQTVTEVRTD